jgi:hypothetical protein
MTDPGALIGRGMSFPPRLGENGRFAWSAGEQSVREAIRVILVTDLRERVHLAEFGAGLRRFLFEPNTLAARHQIREHITTALGRWEPRIRVESVEVVPDPDDSAAAIATIQYQLVATRERERVALSVTLGG